MQIQYFHDRPISAEQFVDLLKQSTLAERRPIADPARIGNMLAQANLLCTAWAGPEFPPPTQA